MKRARIDVEVGDDKLSGGKTISFKAEGRTVSAIVHKDSIAGNRLEVEIEKQTKDKVLIAIPGESFSSRKVWIEKDLLK